MGINKEGNMNELKELEILGCRRFVCPNLSIIDEKGKELNLREETIKRSKDMAIEYFKKTYHKPHYSSARHVIPGIVYIAAILENDRRSQEDIKKIFDTSHKTITRWYRDVMDVLDIKRLKEERVKEKRKLKTLDINIDEEFCEIDKEGKALLLEDNTIERAKILASKYFKIADFDHYYPRIKQLWPAFIYAASIIENDRRTQMDIFNVSGITESVISKWYIDIQRVLGLKIICHGTHTITVLEEQYDS